MNFRKMQLLLLGGLCATFGYGQPGVAAENASSRILAAKDLPAECRRAKASFQPLGTQDLDEVKRILGSAMDRLDGRLTQAGSVGEKWRVYLELALLEQQIRSAVKPDPGVLRRILSHFDADGDGLDLVWFLDVKEALDNYVTMLAMVAHPNPRLDFERKMDILAGILEPYVAKPTTEDAVVMRQGLRWLTRTRQAQPLARAIETHFARPNLFIEISAELVNARIAAPYSGTEPVRDCILGTDIHGTSHTVGQTTTELSPHPTLGVFDTVYYGTATVDNVGYYRPVTIYSTSTSNLGACKRIWFDVNGLHSHPTVSKATTNIDIHDIQSAGIGRRLVQRIAWKRSNNQLGEAECITSQHSEQRTNKWFDLLAADPITRANQLYLDSFRRPLVERKLFAEQVRFSTTPRNISIAALQAGGSKMAAPDAPPPALPGADLSLRIHESMINNLAFDILAGRTLHEAKLQAMVMGMLGYLPEQIKHDKNAKPWAITFSRRQPISLTFADGRVKITLHGTRFQAGGNVYALPMDISATYKIEKSYKGFKIVRLGDIRAFPPEPSSKANEENWRQKIPKMLEQQLVSTLLQWQFAKILVPQFSANEFELPNEGKAPTKLQFIQVDARDGWIVIAWKRSPATNKPPIADHQATEWSNNMP